MEMEWKWTTGVKIEGSGMTVEEEEEEEEDMFIVCCYVSATNVTQFGPARQPG